MKFHHPAKIWLSGIALATILNSLANAESLKDQFETSNRTNSSSNLSVLNTLIQALERHTDYRVRQYESENRSLHYLELTDGSVCKLSIEKLGSCNMIYDYSRVNIDCPGKESYRMLGTVAGTVVPPTQHYINNSKSGWTVSTTEISSVYSKTRYDQERPFCDR